MVGLYKTDIKFSICLILLIMQIWTSMFTIKWQFFLHLFTQNDSWTWNESVLPVQPAVFWLVLSCLDIFCGLEKSCTVSGLPVTVWHEYECGRGAGGQRRSPADGMGITRTAGQHVRCSMTSVVAANISSQNTSTWDYQVKLNRSGSHVTTSMCLMFLGVPASVVTWDVQATRNLSLSTYKSVILNCWDSFITHITSDVIILLGLVLSSFILVQMVTFLITTWKTIWHRGGGWRDPLAAWQFRTVLKNGLQVGNGPNTLQNS